ncbi:hypothetical protein AAG747_16835 [Rapidithrix thailandica]|uniref:Tetratricopeptide repeat protein n=1 Tax=Rapidithrix thailandica TaxID=413964 RepID=A0AAW9S7W4_9BACT
MLQKGFTIGWLFSILFSFHVSAQTRLLSQAPQYRQVASQAVTAIYAWNFDSANKYINQLSAQLPEHPVTPFVKALNIYWQEVPIDFESQAFQKHFSYLRKAEKQAESILEQDENNVEGIFFKMIAKAFIMRHYAEQNKSMKAVGEAKVVYRLIKQGFDLQEQFSEFYFTSGLYNYYREAFPERYPLYKPFAVFFQKGDKTKGLKQLQYTSKHGVYTRCEAINYLVWIYLHYEHDSEMAQKYAYQATRFFPKNQLFKVQYIETLTLTGEYQKARQPIRELLHNSNDDFYKMAGYCFRGMEKEFNQQDLKAAKVDYELAEKLAEQLGTRSKDYKTYIYMGLYQYYKQNNNREKQRLYLKLAKEHDHSDYVKRRRKRQ